MKQTIILASTNFSPMEKIIIDYYNKGLSGAQIARKMKVAYDTHKSRMRQIYKITKVDSILQLMIGLYQIGYFNE